MALPLPLTTARMRDAAAQQLETGSLGVWYQPFNGVPIKVYAAEADGWGWTSVRSPPGPGIERTARIVGVGVVLTLVANALHPWLRRFYGTYVVLATAGFLVLLGLTVDRWS